MTGRKVRSPSRDLSCPVVPDEVDVDDEGVSRFGFRMSSRVSSEGG